MGKTLVIHAGTHKTGTTTLQLFLAWNRAKLAAAGCYWPDAGRPRSGDNIDAGHHRIPAEFLATGTSAAFDALIDELAFVNPELAIMSSEDLELLHGRPHVLRHMRDALEQLGYTVKVLFYLRPQASYAESAYAELAKHGYLLDFSDYALTILRDGRFAQDDPTVSLQFDYDKLIASFAEVFGEQHIVVRPFLAGRDPEDLFRDFFTTLYATAKYFDVQGLAIPLLVANEGLTFSQLLGTIHAAAGTPDPTPHRMLSHYFSHLDAAPTSRFRVMVRPEAVHFLERFSASNARLNARFGITIPWVGADDVTPPEAQLWKVAIRQRAILDFCTDVWLG